MTKKKNNHQNEWEGFTDFEIEEMHYAGKGRRESLLSLEREENSY